MADKSRLRREAKPALITIDDRRRLGGLLADDDLCLDPQAAWELETRLDEAAYVDAYKAPESLVTMNTTLQLADADSQQTRLVTLAYPDEAEVFPDSISVLEPLGMALLGSSVGEIVQCPEGHDGAELEIRQIVYQPEQAWAASSVDSGQPHACHK